MENKRWNLPYRNGWIYADRSEPELPVMSLTLINKEEGMRHTLSTYGARDIRHLADILTAAADFAEGAES